MAFVQIQLVTTLQAMPENKRSHEQLEKAAVGLEAAIKSLDEIAVHPQTPYPKHDVEQRANMARNTLRKQLERALGKQKEWEEKNKEKIEAAKEQREAELRRREEQRQKVVDEERQRQEKIKKERDAIAARDRLHAEQRAEEERARVDAEMTTDSETGDKVKRKRKVAPRSTGEGKPKKSLRKKKTDRSDDESEEETHTKKRRRLTTKKESAKFKSAEIVVDSDDDDNGEDALERAERDIERQETPLSEADEKAANDDKMEVDQGADESGKGNDDEDDEATPLHQHTRARRGRVIDSDEEEDEEPVHANGQSGEEDGSHEGGSRPAADTDMAGIDDEEE